MALGAVHEDEREVHSTKLAEVTPRLDEASRGATRGVQESSGKARRAGHGSGTTRPARQRDRPALFDEGAAVYNGVYSEDIFLGRATRVRGMGIAGLRVVVLLLDAGLFNSSVVTEGTAPPFPPPPSQ